jgi:chromosome segregation ATPase
MTEELESLRARHSGIETQVNQLGTKVTVLETSMISLSDSVRALGVQFKEGFDSIEKKIEAQASAKPKLGLDNIVALFVIGSMIAGVNWLLIRQKIEPLEIAFAHHVEKMEPLTEKMAMAQVELQENKRDIVSVFERADHESQARNREQQIQIDRLIASGEAINERQIKLLSQAIENKTRIDGLTRICDELHDKIKP